MFYQFLDMTLQKELIHTKNCIENLSNGIFYQIFDYLDGYDIYKAFSNLNNRFENLLIDPSFLMKIQISSTSEFDYHYKQFINLNKHHILSFHFNNESIQNEIMKPCIIESFDHLESIVLNPILTSKLFVLFFYLDSLPHLSSLTIYLSDYHDDLRDIFHLIFCLRVLKYLKFKLLSSNILNIDARMPLNQPFSSIKYLVINAGCAHNQIINLLLYIPQLSHLSCDYLIKSNNNIKSEMMIKLNDLIHLTVVINDIDFNEFEEFLLKLCSQLQILNVKIHSSDKSYLNANRWEQLISQKMTSLNKFFFSYTDIIYGNFNITSHPLLNDFTASFWINRKWIFKVLAHDDELTYSIRPYS
ncbi:unnamed protein product [Rotaria sp. Silwood1]|nr:unnamed protein product [Rotaria sp. Silwood1]